MKKTSIVCGLVGIAAILIAVAWRVVPAVDGQSRFLSHAMADETAAQPDTSRDPGAKSTTDAKLPRKIIPWIEVNAPYARVARWAHTRPDAILSRPNINYIDHCVEGLPYWSKITDTVIVLTKHKQVDTLYPELMRRKPSKMHIIGGLKTFVLGEDFANPQGWQTIARYAKRVVRITGSNVVVIGCETPLLPFHRGKASIDFDKLRESLSQLRDTGIQFWWHPIRILPNSPDFPTREQDTTRLVQTIHEVLPDSVFLTAYTSWHGFEKNRKSELTLRAKMIDLVGIDHIHDRLFPTPDGYWHYDGGVKKRCNTVAEAVDRLSQPNGGVIMDVFPGGLSWVQVAKEFSQAMSKTKGAEQSTP